MPHWIIHSPSVLRTQALRPLVFGPSVPGVCSVNHLILYIPVATGGKCPDSNYHSFNDGLHCCKIYRSQIDPSVTLGNSQGMEHCSEENTTPCPTMPSQLCDESEISELKDEKEFSFSQHNLDRHCMMIIEIKHELNQFLVQ